MAASAKQVDDIWNAVNRIEENLKSLSVNMEKTSTTLALKIAEADRTHDSLEATDATLAANITRLEKTVNGNGEQGLADKVNTIDTNVTNLMNNQTWLVRAVGVAIIGAATMIGCQQIQNTVMRTEVSKMATIEATDAPPPISTPTPTATPTAPATATEFHTPTPEFVGIIEVTPRFPLPIPTPACDFQEAWYTPNALQRVRDDIGLGATWLYSIPGGQRVSICHEKFVSKDKWLCLDMECDKVVALEIGGVPYGKFEVVTP